MIRVYAGDLAHQLADGCHRLTLRWEILDYRRQTKPRFIAPVELSLDPSADQTDEHISGRRSRPAPRRLEGPRSHLVLISRYL